MKGLPASPSHMLWLLWGPAQELDEMAFSVQGELYIALYGVSEDDATPFRVVSDQSLRRLSAVRSQYDPDGVFHTWMGVP